MPDLVLQYRAHVSPDDLDPGQCTIRPTRATSGAAWWELWICIGLDADAVPELVAVPVAPGGQWNPAGPGGKTWGLNPAGQGVGMWDVSPSIDVYGDADARRVAEGGSRQGPSRWHHTPRISGVVPPDAPWIGRPAP